MAENFGRPRSLFVSRRFAAQLCLSRATPKPARQAVDARRKREMKRMAGKLAGITIALGMSLGGCASIQSVIDAQDTANAADQHAGAARARADEAYGIGSDARAIGNNALSSAQQANEKADATAADVDQLERRVSNLENRPQL